MSSPERNFFSAWARLRPAAASLLVAGLLGASACTVQPLYSDNPVANGAVTGSIASDLSTISVKPVTTRVGQEVRNQLIFLLHGGQAEPAKPRYTLVLAVGSISEASANIQINTENEPTAARRDCAGKLHAHRFKGHGRGKRQSPVRGVLRRAAPGICSAESSHRRGKPRRP